MKEKVGVVGAGLMGAEIALVFALAGHDVLLSDRTEAELKTALERLGRVLDRGMGRGFYKEAEKPAALARIRTTTALDDVAGLAHVAGRADPRLRDRPRHRGDRIAAGPRRLQGTGPGQERPGPPGQPQ